MCLFHSVHYSAYLLNSQSNPKTILSSFEKPKPKAERGSISSLWHILNFLNFEMLRFMFKFNLAIYTACSAYASLHTLCKVSFSRITDNQLLSNLCNLLEQPHRNQRADSQMNFIHFQNNIYHLVETITILLESSLPYYTINTLLTIITTCACSNDIRYYPQHKIKFHNTYFKKSTQKGSNI